MREKFFLSLASCAAMIALAGADVRAQPKIQPAPLTPVAPPGAAPPAPPGAPNAPPGAPAAAANPAPGAKPAAAAGPGAKLQAGTQGLSQFETGGEYPPRNQADRGCFALEDAAPP